MAAIERRLYKPSPSEKTPATIHFEKVVKTRRAEKEALAKAAALEALKIAAQEREAELRDSDELRERAVQLLGNLDKAGMKSLLSGGC